MIYGKQISWSKVFQYPYCLTFDLEEYFQLNEFTPQELQLYFGNVKNFGLSLHFLEKNKVTRRTLRNNYLSYEGPAIKLSDLFLEKGTNIELMVKMSQIIKADTDPNSLCKNYPYKNFFNYDQCDQAYVNNFLQEKLKITPFWATQDLKNITVIRSVLMSY